MNNIEIKSLRRIQRVSEPCFLKDKHGNVVPLYHEKTVFWYWKDGIKECQVVSSPKRAIEMVAEAEKKGRGAFASAPVPCNNGQHGVIAVSCAGETRSIFFGKFYADIKKAHDSVFGIETTISGKEMSIQKIVKEEPLIKTVLCVFDDDLDWQPEDDCRHYTFRTEEDLNVGEHIKCVTKNGKEKYVTVTHVNQPCKASELPHELGWYVMLKR